MSSLFAPEQQTGLLVHEWTKRHSDLPQQEQTDAAHGTWQALLGEADARIPAPALDLPATDTLAAFDRRRSIRRYADRPVTQRELFSLLKLAAPGTTDTRQATGVQRWRGSSTSCLLVPLIFRAEGLEVGAYRYAADAPALLPLRQDDPAQIWREVCYQVEFHSAPAVVLIVASPAEYLERYGDRGYRYLLLDVGVQAQRLSLACSALDFGGVIAGSITPPRLNGWLGLDGYQASVMLTFPIGGFITTVRFRNDEHHLDRPVPGRV